MMEASHRGTRFLHNQSLHLIGININECFDSLPSKVSSVGTLRRQDAC